MATATAKTGKTADSGDATAAVSSRTAIGPGGQSQIMRGVPGAWAVPRRSFLTGAAAMIGLPILDIMGPSLRRAYAAGAPGTKAIRHSSVFRRV